jgi:hypothetical protein
VKGTGFGPLSQHLPRQKKYLEVSISVVGLRAEIRTRGLPNAKQKLSCWDLLSDSMSLVSLLVTVCKR